jgi:arylsulfatase A-like enzyme
MNRRNFIGRMGSGIGWMGSAIGLGNAGPALAMAQTSSQRPNFLFIICDDLMFRTLHSLNNPEVHTPNMDRLAASGCAFTHCFHQGSWSPAVCVPSRTMLNSGLSAFHAEAGIDEVPTWGQTLGNAGYDTYICGKWHLDPTVLQRSFKEMGPVAPGMLVSTPEGGAAYGRPHPGDRWEPWDESLKGHWIHTNLWTNRTPDRIEHAAALYSDCFIDHLLNKAAKRNTPFFMYLGFNSPHDPRQAPKEYLDRYPQDKIQVPPNFLPEHPFDQGDYKVRDELLAPFPRTPEAVQLHRREYYALITFVDQQIGRILDALQQSGKASNTYVILTADHGLAVGEHGLMGKQNLYDCSVRMPLLISGPGITPGKRIDSLVYQHSMYATTCDLAQVPIPHTIEFPSLAPLLRGEDRPANEAVFSYYRSFQRMVRTKTHKLIVYPQIRRIQVFDIEKDPWEMHDLSQDSGLAEIKQDLMHRLKSLQQELGDKLSLGL